MKITTTKVTKWGTFIAVALFTGALVIRYGQTINEKLFAPTLGRVGL